VEAFEAADSKRLKTLAVSTKAQFYNMFILSIKKKDKAIPLQAWTGPEGSRRLRLPDLKTVVA
jgi:hypothetical protein